MRPWLVVSRAAALVLPGTVWKDMWTMRRGYLALTSGLSLLLLAGFGGAVWAIIASVEQAAHLGFTLDHGVDQAAHDAMTPVLAWTLLSLPLIWIVGTMALLAVARREEVSFPLLLVILGQFLCLVVWFLPLECPYGLGMGAWVMWSARRRSLDGRAYRAAIGAPLTFSGVLYTAELTAGPSLWSLLVCFGLFLAPYCALMLVRPAILYPQTQELGR